MYCWIFLGSTQKTRLSKYATWSLAVETVHSAWLPLRLVSEASSFHSRSSSCWPNSRGSGSLPPRQVASHAKSVVSRLPEIT